MKINKIHQELKSLYKNKSDVFDTLGFDVSTTDERKRVINIFKQGYWSVAFFSSSIHDNYGFKLTPNILSVKESFIVKSSGDDFTIFSPNFKSFIAMIQLDFLKNVKFKSILKKDWNKIEELSLPFREYADGLDSLEFLKGYLDNSDKQKYFDNLEWDYMKIYIDFWNHYNNTPEQKEISLLMDEFYEDPSFLPPFEIKDYGLWTNRIYNAIGQRAHRKLKTSFNNLELYYWQSLIQPHGFDAVKMVFDSLVPLNTNNSKNSLWSITDEFDLNPDLSREISKEILEHPLFDSIQAIRKDIDGYVGKEHLEAAKVFEMNNDPISAWNSLISASYWAGKNGGFCLVEAWEAAINLSKKENWTEIHEVLVQQYEYYNFYKDKI